MKRYSSDFENHVADQLGYIRGQLEAKEVQCAAHKKALEDQEERTRAMEKSINGGEGKMGIHSWLNIFRVAIISLFVLIASMESSVEASTVKKLLSVLKFW